MVVCLLYQMGPYSNLKNQRTVSIPAEVGMDDDIVCHCYLVKYVKASEKIAGHIQNVPCIQSKNEHFIPAEHEVCFIRVNFFRLLYGSIGNQSPKRGQEVKMCITIQYRVINIMLKNLKSHVYVSQTERKTLIP